jgi:hypothetical protein
MQFAAAHQFLRLVALEHRLSQVHPGQVSAGRDEDGASPRVVDTLILDLAGSGGSEKSADGDEGLLGADGIGWRIEEDDRVKRPIIHLRMRLGVSNQRMTSSEGHAIVIAAA